MKKASILIEHLARFYFIFLCTDRCRKRIDPIVDEQVAMDVRQGRR